MPQNIRLEPTIIVILGAGGDLAWRKLVPDAAGGLIYQIEASAVKSKDDDSVRDELRKIIEPISGAVAVTKFEPVRDRFGRIQSYRVWVQKE